MKEILFRGKKDIYGPWIFGNLIHELSIDPISKEKIEYYGIQENDSYCEVAQQYPVKNYTIGQYTGMNDIHGNKIFEGDIVNSSFFDRGIVVYLEAVGAYIVSTEPPEFITVDENWNSFDCNWIFICDCNDLEVIGNYADGVFIHPIVKGNEVTDDKL